MRFDFANTKKWKPDGHSFKLINPDPERDKLYSYGSFKAVSNDDDDSVIIRGMANAKVIDRMDEVLDPRGIDVRGFTKNAVLLLGHNYDAPIGLVTELEAQEDGIHFVSSVGSPKKATLTEDQIKARSLIKQGILRTVSVGFIPKKVRQAERDGDGNLVKPTMIEEWELLELSVVAVPANQDSVFEQVDIRQNQKQHDKLLGTGVNLLSQVLNNSSIENAIKNQLVISLHLDKSKFNKSSAIGFCVDNGFDFDFINDEDTRFEFSTQKRSDTTEAETTLIQEGVHAVTIKIKNKDHDNEIPVKELPEDLAAALGEMMTLIRSVADAAKANSETLQEVLNAVGANKPDDEEAPAEEDEEAKMEDDEEEEKMDDEDEDDEKSLPSRLAKLEGNIEKLTDVVSRLINK